MPCYLYILRSLKDGNLYTGIAVDVGERFRYHSRGGSRSTRHRLPLELVYVEEHADRSAAAKRERQLKSLEGGAEKHSIVAGLTAEDIARTQERYL